MTTVMQTMDPALVEFLNQAKLTMRNTAFVTRSEGRTIGHVTIDEMVLKDPMARPLDATRLLELAIQDLEPIELCRLAGAAVRSNQTVERLIGEYFREREEIEDLIDPDAVFSTDTVLAQRCPAVLEELHTMERECATEGDTTGFIIPWAGGTMLSLARWLINFLLMPMLKKELTGVIGILPDEEHGIEGNPEITGVGLYHSRERKLREARAAQAA